MAKYTENIRLAQPEGSDYYDIEVFNHNSELIDKKIGEMDNSLSTIKEGATREKAGIVQFGTEEGKALEGMMLARLAGCVGYGGDIQTAGVKDVNYIYYDRNTRKMYKCLNQNSDVSANVANFIPLDNNSLLDRLENLIKTDSYNQQNSGYFELFGRVIYYGTFQFNGSSTYTQDFILQREIPNWQNANVICSLRETNQKFIDKTFSGKLSSSNKLSIRANLSNAEMVTVSFLIIARV
ncbi:ribose-phosphate pyrophosphokinase [Fusobacterium polymorphum]|uniref:ribose-phosphate pyrophosphokinase n=1 Tax=Fusobacterium nucleatum subsp. polymorphum TaxID=76857 RepID=UPI0021C2EAB6|nr:ribose-phosphate pyrophosphokinase [Fusobacterium polymorphum]